MSQAIKAHLSHSEIVRQEMRDQHDPSVRAARLARFRASTVNKSWRQLGNGQWVMVDAPEESPALSILTCYEL